MIAISIAVCSIVALFFVRSRRLDYLFGWYVLAVLAGAIIPFGFLVSWALMTRAKFKPGQEPKPDTFDKAFDWDNEI